MNTRRELEDALRPYTTSPERDADVESPVAQAFYEYLMEQYRPPEDKRLLVFFQCSVRRPFSKSTSHAFMRRAVAVATGYDPRRDSQACPVHVVVLASTLGPVPYELEDVYPANVRSVGVKRFSESRYARARPLLAERIAGYLRAHARHYDEVAAFTHGRYAEVMADARAAAGRSFAIFPVLGGPAVVRMGTSVPRTYWQRHWIQLYFEVVGWLPPAEQARADQRLRALSVVYT